MNGWPRRVLVIGAFALAVTVATPSARAAEPAQDPAAAAFDEGTRSFRLGRFAEAATSYERAAAVRPNALALVNAAEAWERAGQPVQAAIACDRALLLPMNGDLRSKIELRLERLLTRIATLEISGGEGFEVRVDGGDPLRPPATLRVTPGRHRVTMTSTRMSSDVDRELLVAAGETHHLVLTASRIDVSEPVTLPASAPAAAASPAADAPSGGPPASSWIAFGIAGAAGIASGVFGAMTLGAKSDYDAKPTIESADDFDRYRLLTNVSLGAAALTTAIGIVFWIVKPAQAPARSQAGLRF